MRLLLSSVLSLFICSSVLAAEVGPVKYSLFNIKPLYMEPMANPRTPDSSATVNTSRYLGQRVKYFEVSLGKNIPIITVDTGRGLIFQLGLAGGFWGTLGYDEGTFPLLTEDFLVSIPLEFKWGNISGALKFNHISAHLGDGFEGLLEEDLSKRDKRNLDTAEDILEDLSGQDVGIILKEPFAYSRDFMSAHIAYSYKINRFDSRMYAHAGYSHKIIPHNLGGWFVGSGTEIVYPSGILAPYYAQDITWHEDTDSVDLSAELGVIVLSSETKYYSLRIAFTGYIGTDRRGQLMNNKLRQLGFGFFIY